MPDFPWLLFIVVLLVALLVLLVAHRAGMFDILLDALSSSIDRLLGIGGLGGDSLVGGEVDNALRRMWPLWLLFVACFAVVLFINPMKAGLAIYGIGKISLGGVVGYLVSYCVTARMHRPEAPLDGIALGTALKCRTWIICAAMLCMAFGVP
jgi:hypothetical protein